MKRSSQIVQKNDDVIDDVTIIIKLPVHMYHEIMTTIIQIYIPDVIDDVTRSQNRSNFEIDISP